MRKLTKPTEHMYSSTIRYVTHAAQRVYKGKKELRIAFVLGAVRMHATPWRIPYGLLVPYGCMRVPSDVRAFDMITGQGTV